MNIQCHKCTFCCFSYSMPTLLKPFKIPFKKIFSLKNFSLVDDLSSKLVKNNQKITQKKYSYLFYQFCLSNIYSK